MEDLKKFILTNEELNKIWKNDDLSAIDYLAFFVEHSRNVVPDNVNAYKKMIEYEEGLGEEIFSFVFDTYHYDEFNLSDDEFVNIVVNCFAEYELDYAYFYEEDNEYCMAQYGVPLKEYICNQMTEFLSMYNLAVDDLPYDLSDVYEGVSYSIHIVKIIKEYIPFEKIYQLFGLTKTSIPNTYVIVNEDYHDGYYYNEHLFKLESLKKILLDSNTNILEKNIHTANKIRKLKTTINYSNMVNTFFSIFNTESEVMF